MPSEPILWEGASEEGCVATRRLTVWRKLHVEVDSMGTAVGAPFVNDDLLVGDVPNPDTSALSGAFDDAFISVDVGTPYDNSATPFQHSFTTNTTALGDYAEAQRGIVDSTNAYWAVYSLGIYEAYSLLRNDDYSLDNDDDTLGDDEPGLCGFQVSGLTVVIMEVLRDVANENNWTASQKTHVGRAVTLHEIGHSFGLWHDYSYPPADPPSVMWAPDNDADEARMPQMPTVFKDSDLLTIRRDTEKPQ